MKYNIIINQLVLSKSKLSLIDCAILDYLYFICNSNNEKIEKQRVSYKEKKWTWINYDKLLKDMPLLRIKSSGAISRRLQKIEKAGYIKTYRESHQKLYICLTKKIDELFTDINRAIDINQQSYSHLSTNNTTIDNTTNNKDNNTKVLGLRKDQDVFNMISKFKEINPSYKKMFSNTTQRKCLERLIKEHGKEKIENLLSLLPKVNTMPYAPVITTPYELEEKLAKLLLFIKKRSDEFNKNKITKIQ